MKKKTIHKLAKKLPRKTYRELEKYRDADRWEEAQKIFIQQENEELKSLNGSLENHEKEKNKLETCSVCETNFDLDAEGGTKGEFGILPVAFCPTCLSSTFDMVEQLK